MSFFSHFAHPHWPNLSLIAQVPLVIQIHLMAALAAFAIATFQILGPKGTTLHRTLGWIWVLFMGTVAISSLWIKLINRGHFSVIHILSLVTLVALPILVYAARTHKVDLHKRTARNLYLGALIGAGVFTFFPGRLMWQIFFG